MRNQLAPSRIVSMSHLPKSRWSWYPAIRNRVTSSWVISGLFSALGVIDIWGVPELRGIARDKGGLRLGALTTCTDLCRDDQVPDVLAAAAWEVGAEQIREHLLG